MKNVKLNSIELLLNRQSHPKLTAPCPDDKDLQVILSAGMRVPDHGALTPWHFTIVKAEGLKKLSELFLQVSKVNTDDEIKHIKAAKMPKRAPLIIIVSTKFEMHSKVPEQEQLITAGCCVHAMQMAAYSLGYGAMWRTGAMSYDPLVKSGLKITAGNEIVGFLYIGTIDKLLPNKPAKDFSSHISYL